MFPSITEILECPSVRCFSSIKVDKIDYFMYLFCDLVFFWRWKFAFVLTTFFLFIAIVINRRFCHDEKNIFHAKRD